MRSLLQPFIHSSRRLLCRDLTTRLYKPWLVLKWRMQIAWFPRWRCYPLLAQAEMAVGVHLFAYGALRGNLVLHPVLFWKAVYRKAKPILAEISSMLATIHTWSDGTTSESCCFGYVIVFFRNKRDCFESHYFAVRTSSLTRRVTSITGTSIPPCSRSRALPLRSVFTRCAQSGARLTLSSM